MCFLGSLIFGTGIGFLRRDRTLESRRFSFLDQKEHSLRVSSFIYLHSCHFSSLSPRLLAIASRLSSSVPQVGITMEPE